MSKRILIRNAINVAAENSNPDNYSDYSNLYVNKDSWSSGELTGVGGSSQFNYEADGGWDGTSVFGWEPLVTLDGQNGIGGGWFSDPDAITDNPQQLMISFIYKMGQPLVTTPLGNGTTTETNQHLAKLVDLQWADASGNYNQNENRFVLKVNTSGGREVVGKPFPLSTHETYADAVDAGHMVFVDNHGGAGQDYGIQGPNGGESNQSTDWYTNFADYFRMDDYPDEWIWFGIMLDGGSGGSGYHRFYVKRRNNASGSAYKTVTRIMSRPRVPHWDEDIYGDLGAISAFTYAAPSATYGYGTFATGTGDPRLEFGNYWSRVLSGHVGQGSIFWMDRIRAADGWDGPPGNF